MIASASSQSRDGRGVAIGGPCTASARLRRLPAPRLHPAPTSRWGRPARPRLRAPASRCLARVLDVAGLAVNAVLRVDLQAVVAAFRFHRLVHAGRAIAAFRGGELLPVDAFPAARVLEPQVDRLVLLVVRVADEHGGQLVEGDLAVGLEILDPRRPGGESQRLVVAVLVVERPGARPRSTNVSTAEYAMPPNRPNRAKAGRMLRAPFSSVRSQLDLNRASNVSGSAGRPSASASATASASAASMPDFMAAWVPLILGTFRNPAASPIKAPLGKVSFGMDWKPPSLKARAP